MKMTVREFNVNRAGLTMMIGAVVIKLVLFVIY
jgi:hypothetical protein